MKTYNVIVLQVNGNKKLLTYYGDNTEKSKRKILTKAKFYGKVIEIY